MAIRKGVTVHVELRKQSKPVGPLKALLSLPQFLQMETEESAVSFLM